MTDLRFKDHRISFRYYISPDPSAPRYAFVCSIAGRRVESDIRYSTSRGAVAACKRWITKGGLQP